MEFKYYFPNLSKIAIDKKISKMPITINAIIKIFVKVELFDTFDALLTVVERVLVVSKEVSVSTFVSFVFWVVFISDMEFKSSVVSVFDIIFKSMF